MTRRHPARYRMKAPHVCTPPTSRRIHGAKPDLVICSCDQTLYRRKWWGWQDQRLAAPVTYPAAWR